MYKLLLCVRYLQTRYLAFICIVSVMLGVATLIVVNAVMSGFSTKLKDRLHGVLSDVVIDTDRTDGFYLPDANGQPLPPDAIIKKIMDSPAGDKIAAVTPTIETFAIIQYRYRGTVIAKPVRLIGIDPEGRASVGGFSEYLVRQKDAARPNFDLSPEAIQRHEWNVKQFHNQNGPNVPAPKAAPLVKDPNALPEPDLNVMMDGIAKPKLHGVIVGYAIAHFRYRDKDDQPVEQRALEQGDDVLLTTAGGQDLKPVWGSFLVTDYLKTEMSEYDQSFVYVPLDQLQKIRGMTERATAFQIKLKNYERDKAFVSKELRAVFSDAPEVRIATWEEHQGPLLAAIDVERGILNLLLFMIVGVAGFSILAIFTGTGLLPWQAAVALGTAMGLWITWKINEIEAFLTRQTGTALFPRDVYYFKDIPTNVDPLTVAYIVVGAVVIATTFSLLPAWRAARLQPVRALRFE